MQGLNAMFIEVLLDQYMHSYLQGVETFFSSLREKGFRSSSCWIQNLWNRVCFYQLKKVPKGYGIVKKNQTQYRIIIDQLKIKVAFFFFFFEVAFYSLLSVVFDI